MSADQSGRVSSPHRDESRFSPLVRRLTRDHLYLNPLGWSFWLCLALLAVIAVVTL